MSILSFTGVDAGRISSFRGVLIAVLLVFVASCDGSDNEGTRSPADSSGSSAGDPFPALNLNGSLTGRAFETGKASYFDLNTGETVQLAGDSAYPGPDGSEVIEIHEDFRFLPDGGCYDFAIFNDLIIIRDALTGVVKESFELAEDVYGPVRLSPDGQTLAMFWSKSHTCYEEDNSLTIFSRKGEEIIRGSDKISSFDWLPDNRLVFTFEQKLVVEVERNTFRYQTIVDMSNIEGTPGRVAVSPDGTQILFEMITENSLWLSTVSFRRGTAWAINTDGSDLRRVATTSRADDPDSTSDDPQVNMPIWSPDGGTILVTEDFTSGGIVLVDDAYVVLDVFPVSNEGLTYAMPATTTDQRLPPSSYSDDGVRPLFGTNLEGEYRAVGLNPFATLMWAVEMPRAPVIQGSLPSFNSRINRGLEGKLYRMQPADGDYDDPALQVLDLATGTETVTTRFDDELLSVFDSSLAISADAQLSAHQAYEWSDEQYLRIYNAEGQQLHSLSFISSNYYYVPESGTELRFSPVNNDYIAWVYDDDNFGTGIVVLDLSTRSFKAVFNDLDYDNLAWTNEGDLLLFDEGKAYRSTLQQAVFGTPEELFDFGELIKQPDVNPINNDIAFSAGGQIFAIGIDGQNIRRMTAYTDEAVDFPAWSPDGKYLSVKRNNFGYIIAADTLNARLYDDGRSLGAFQLGESGERTRTSRGRMEWR